MYMCTTCSELDVAQWLVRRVVNREGRIRASEFKSEDPGFDSLAGRMMGQFSVSPSQVLCRPVCA